jgi:hypothetical protein
VLARRERHDLDGEQGVLSVEALETLDLRLHDLGITYLLPQIGL